MLKFRRRVVYRNILRLCVKCDWSKCCLSSKRHYCHNYTSRESENVEEQRKAFTRAELLHLYELICQNCDNKGQPSGNGGFV